MTSTAQFSEQAFKADPRIQKFKEEDKYAKEAKKRGREAAARAAEEEAKKVGTLELLQRDRF